MTNVPSFLKLLIVYFLIGTSAYAQSNWSKAHDCFNSGDFECAFDTAIELAKERRIVVGNDHRTTDSMTFFQMAFVETAARVDSEELLNVAGAVIPAFGQSGNRYPFVWGFSILTVLDISNGDEYAQLVTLFCRVDDELPPPTWRPLNNVNGLSEIGQLYFGRVLQLKPNCVGS